MVKAYKKAFANYATFSGRATVSEYWLAVLMNFIVALVLGAVTGILTAILGGISDGNSAVMAIAGLPSSIYSLAIIIPFAALAVRRLHDQGRSGWWYIGCLIGSLCCGIGSIVLLVLMCLPGTQGPNQYGSDPKAYDGQQNFGGQQFNNQYNQYNGYNGQNGPY